MSYFSDAYGAVRLPVGGEDSWRAPQLGALHAICAHFTLRREPALVVMPTGSGKTAVLFAAAMMLRARRCLVITPSQMVRSQIAEGFRSLAVLKLIKAVPDDQIGPKVKEVRNKFTSLEEWEELREYDAVVAIPLCVSPGSHGVAEPPKDLFDVVLVDEAHHSPAGSWQKLLDHYSESKRVLFTATPFRRDRQDIEGRFVFTYPIRQAFQDGVFGNIRFVPVDAITGTEDAAIARKTEETFIADKAVGLAHRIMVRTDSKKRAGELEEIYGSFTKLKLAMIHSDRSLAYVTDALEKLRSGDLDGVICVAMLGEGFDFPNLKIAAIHAPHKSLAVTLQFIGRFARTSAPNVGEAKFISVPRLINAETKDLFRESAVWQEIVQNLSASRVDEEAEVREVHQSFTRIESPIGDDFELSVSELTPFTHVKIFSVERFQNASEWPRFIGSIEPTHLYEVNDAQDIVYFVTKRSEVPEWTDIPEFASVQYDFHLVYFDRKAKLLFIHSSLRTEQVYDSIAEHYSAGTHRRLPLHKINRVLRGIANLEAFNVGMRNRSQSSAAESYRTLAGPAAHRAVSATDGRMYHRGHVFLRGDTGGAAQTIGYSSSSKVWAAQHMRVGELVRWCRQLSGKLTSTDPVLTRSNLDILGVGEQLTTIPRGIVAARWREEVYSSGARLVWSDCGDPHRLHLAECEILIGEQKLNSEGDVVSMFVTIAASPILVELVLTMHDGACKYEFASKSNHASVLVGKDSESLERYLQIEGLEFYLHDLSLWDGASLFQAPAVTSQLPMDQLVAVDWTAARIDIQNEARTPLNWATASSIQDHVAALLLQSPAEILIFDHGTGEVGDFITFRRVADRPEFTIDIYHCKASGGPAPGNRVGDLYDVEGQVCKSVIWIRTKERLLDKLRDRLRGKSCLLRGKQSDLEELLGHAQLQPIVTIWLVQPGFSRDNLEEPIGTGLQAADLFVRQACGGAVKVMCSP